MAALRKLPRKPLGGFSRLRLALAAGAAQRVAGKYGVIQGLGGGFVADEALIEGFTGQVTPSAGSHG